MATFGDDDITLQQESALPFIVLTRPRLAILCATCTLAGIAIGLIAMGIL